MNLASEPPNNSTSADSTQSSPAMTSVPQPAANHALESLETTTKTHKEEPISYIRKFVSRFQVPSPRHKPKRIFAPIPQTPQERRDASLTEQPLRAETLSRSEIQAAEEKGKTVLYLAYGSNLCNETFRGVRGIKPLSQINVVVPSLRLTFDLPGIPYYEPCFANSAMRDPSSPPSKAPVYHKDRWHKGMVGCVYEVTPSDYAHIIATEGGGASYQDILIDCYPLASTPTVPSHPTTTPFKAHTLFAPVNPPTSTSTSTSRFHRPDPSYAQPSARYLKLLTDGAAELNLPAEYQAYLHDIRPYTMTTVRQRVGKALFLATWMPILLLVMQLGKMLADEDGRIPKWLGWLVGELFRGMWVSYDVGFKRAFGEGERTEGLGDDDYDDDDDAGEEGEKMGLVGKGTVGGEL